MGDFCLFCADKGAPWSISVFLFYRLLLFINPLYDTVWI